jgi:hypothetical protein
MRIEAESDASDFLVNSTDSLAARLALQEKNSATRAMIATATEATSAKVFIQERIPHFISLMPP